MTKQKEKTTEAEADLDPVIQEYYRKECMYKTPEVLLEAFTAALRIARDGAEKSGHPLPESITTSSGPLSMTFRPARWISIEVRHIEVVRLYHGSKKPDFTNGHTYRNGTQLTLVEVDTIGAHLVDVTGMMMEKIHQADLAFEEANTVVKKISEGTLLAIQKTFPEELMDMFVEAE